MLGFVSHVFCQRIRKTQAFSVMKNPEPASIAPYDGRFVKTLRFSKSSVAFGEGDGSSLMRGAFDSALPFRRGAGTSAFGFAPASRPLAVRRLSAVNHLIPAKRRLGICGVFFPLVHRGRAGSRARAFVPRQSVRNFRRA